MFWLSSWLCGVLFLRGLCSTFPALCILAPFLPMGSALRARSVLALAPTAPAAPLRVEMQDPAGCSVCHREMAGTRGQAVLLCKPKSISDGSLPKSVMRSGGLEIDLWRLLGWHGEIPKRKGAKSFGIFLNGFPTISCLSWGPRGDGAQS